jgi:hypothetical protein
MLVKLGYCKVELGECDDVLNQSTVHFCSEDYAYRRRACLVWSRCW